MIKNPRHLQKNDTIAIVCPSGYMPFERMNMCIEVLQQWGFKVRLGKTAGNQFHYFSGMDEERLADLQQMLDDKEVSAILCGRGGYGLSRIIDKLDFKQFKKHPKWIIGYSDITLLHAHLFSKIEVASLHSPMAGAFNDEGFKTEYVHSLQKALTGKKYNYSCAVQELNKPGKATGILVGGNLAMVTHTIGSSSEIDTKNKILFLEDVGEYLYKIDRMMLQLKRAGKLDQLAGIIFGSFSELKDTTIPFGSDVYSILYEKVKEYQYPVCFDFPVGHTEKNYALKHGAPHQLIVASKKVSLKEINL